MNSRAISRNATAIAFTAALFSTTSLLPAALLGPHPAFAHGGGGHGAAASAHVGGGLGAGDMDASGGAGTNTSPGTSAG